MLKRIIFTAMLFIAIFVAPWWVGFIFSVIGIFYFNSYYEAIVLGILFDILYGVKGSISLGYGIMGFIVMIISFFIIKRVKQELRD